VIDRFAFQPLVMKRSELEALKRRSEALALRSTGVREVLQNIRDSIEDITQMLEHQVDVSPAATVANPKLGTCSNGSAQLVCQAQHQASPNHTGSLSQPLSRSAVENSIVPVSAEWLPDATENPSVLAWPVLADHVSPFDDRFFMNRQPEIPDISPCTGASASHRTPKRSRASQPSDASPSRCLKERPSSTSSSPQRRKGFPKVAWTATTSTVSPQSKNSCLSNSPQDVTRGRLVIRERPSPSGQHESGEVSVAGETNDCTSCVTPRFEIGRVAAGMSTSNRSPSCRQRRRSPSERVIRLLPHVQQILGSTEGSEAVCATAESQLFESLPTENVQDLNLVALHCNQSREQFLNKRRDEGNDASRIRTAWHLAGSAAAAQAIETGGIRCDDGHCACGRYGRGGYVATSAAKANAYADSDGNGGDRHLFLVLALPGDELVRGERGTRPPCTAADLPSHPTEYCFVDPSRLHCVCRLDYTWVPTGRRPKVTTAGGHCRAWRSSSRLASPRRR